MADLYFNDKGDLEISPNGDLALTPNAWRDDLQQIYVRIMTDTGDWEPYPTLGAGLSRLYGLPQSPETGQYGVDLIKSALDRESRFVGKRYQVTAVPTGPQSIRFDVKMVSRSQENITLSVEQELA